MRKSGILAVGLTVTAIAVGPAAQAETVGLGSTKGGALAQIATTIAKVVSTHTDHQMRTQPMGGTQQYIPVVNAGELQFGISNMMQAYMAVTGTGLSKGHKFDNIRLIATMMQFQTGLLATNESGMKTIADLKGKRVPYGFRASPLFHILMEGKIANGGLSWDDVENVSVVAMRQHRDMFKQGRVDTAIGAPGAAIVKELNASISGGVRFLTFDDTGPNAAKTLEMLPKTYWVKVEPSSKFVAVPEPVTLIAYDFMLWAHKGISDEVAHAVAKAMYENESDLKASSALWVRHSKDRMAKDQGWPYHPGAEKFYKEVGIWKR